MKAIINSSDNNYYASKIFAIKNDKINDRFYAGFSYEYLVFNKDLSNLVFKKQYDMTPHIKTNVLIFDTDTSDMQLDSNKIGKVDFISDEEIKSIIEGGSISPDLLVKCKEYKVSYNGEYIDITNENDIANLMVLTHRFHDSMIEKIERNANDELVICFDGVWGCKIEMVFSKDVKFQNLSNMDGGDPIWYGSTMLFDDGKLFFTNEENYSIDKQLRDDSTWICANKIKYKIIPFYNN